MTTPNRTRSLLVNALVIGLTLLTVSPAAGYNEENVKHVRMARLDPIGCSVPIRVAATLTDSVGSPVPGAETDFSYKKHAVGDTIAPVVVFSDESGFAETTITLSCVIGSRIIVASVPGDGSAQLVVTCSPRNGCTDKPHHAVLAPTGQHHSRESLRASAADLHLVALSEPVDSTRSAWIGLVIAAAVAVAIVALSLLGRRRRWSHEDS